MKYIFMLFFVVSTLFAAKDYPVMLQIKSDLNIPDDLRTGIEDGLTENDFSLISEEVQKEALKEQAEQRQKECYDESCLVDTGKMLAAKGLVIVEIVKKNEKYYLFKAKYIDFESGTTQKTKSDYFEYDLNEFKELNKFGKNLIINTMVKKENKEEIKEIETAETTESKINDKMQENNTIIECEYKIYTNIFGASIYVDNEYKGTTPLTINVKKGKHTVKAIKENYTAYFEEVSIFEDDELYIKLNENKTVDENKSKEFFSEINREFYTSYKYLDFKNTETKNIFAIGFYIHYLFERYFLF